MSPAIPLCRRPFAALSPFVMCSTTAVYLRRSRDTGSLNLGRVPLSANRLTPCPCGCQRNVNREGRIRVNAPKLARPVEYTACERGRVRVRPHFSFVTESGVFMTALSWFSNDLAIDLGTANTCVFARGAASSRASRPSSPSIG